VATGGPLNDETLLGFASRLERFAESFSSQERRALETLLIRAMDPLDRAVLRGAAGGFDPAEEAIVRALERAPAKEEPKAEE
jgi:hypothetical protein